MTRLGPEFRGKLQPGAQEMLDMSLNGWRRTNTECGYEMVIGCEVLGATDCPAAMAYQGVFFPLATPPLLPFEGCERSPCCACCFIAVLDDEDGSGARPIPPPAPPSPHQLR